MSTVCIRDVVATGVRAITVVVATMTNTAANPPIDFMFALQCCLKALRACQRGRDQGMKPFTLRTVQSQERWLRQQQRPMDALLRLASE
jgi:hypothetical protein